MFNFKRSNADELTEEEEKKVKEKISSFKEKSYSEDDMNKVFDNEDRIMGKMNDEKLMAFIDEVKVFFMMLKDFFTRKYTEVPVGTIVAMAGSLLYVLSPIDIIPDCIPVLGYLDDAAVIKGCLNLVKVDVEKYKEYKGLNK